MDQKALHVMEVTKNERVYQFHMPLHAPVGEAYDSLCDFLVEIQEQAKKITEAVEKNKQEKAAAEEKAKAESKE